MGARTVETDENTDQPKEPGAINGGIVKRDQYSKTPTVTINVPSIDEYLKKLNKPEAGLSSRRNSSRAWDIMHIYQTPKEIF